MNGYALIATGRKPFARGYQFAEGDFQCDDVRKTNTVAALLLGRLLSAKFPSTTSLYGRANILTDALLGTRDQEERLSMAYAHAVAARAGYITAVYDLDRDGIDLRIQAGGLMRPALELQLKATINLGPLRNGAFPYPLPSRNHNLLCIPTQTPRLLVVLDLPRDQEQWMTVTLDELTIRHSAYWADLSGRDETQNAESITVQIPEGNLFNVPNLQALMDQSRSGRIQ